MITRKSFAIWGVLMLLIIALATMGLTYGHWTSLLRVEGTVNTGTFIAEFLDVFTDDDGAVYNASYDDGDIGTCDIGAGSCDPSLGGPNPARYDKGVGACASWISEGKLYFQLDNTYPSYHCTIWARVNNPGSIPWKFTGERYSFDPTKLAIEWVDGSPSCGDQVDASTVSEYAGITVHVLQDALPESSYTGWLEFDVVNWNEFDESMCTSTFVP